MWPILRQRRGLPPSTAPSHARDRRKRLNFIATEIHKSWYQRFNPAVDDSSKVHFADRLHKKYALLNDRLAKAGWVSGDAFGVADAYLFVTTFWRNFIPLDLPGLNALEAFVEKMKARPSVQEAMRAEGLA